VSAGLLVLVLSFADWRAVWQVMRSVEIGWVGAALVLAIVDRLITNYRWQVLLEGRGVKLGFMRLFRVQLLANFIGSFLPGFIGVDAVRITSLCRSGEPTAPVIAATLVDRFTIALATLLLGAATVLALARARLPPHVVQFVLLLTVVAVIAVALTLHPAVRRWARRALLPLVPERLRHTVSEVATASMAYRHQPAMAGGVTLLTLVLFAVRILFAKTLGLACGVDLAFTDLLLVIPVLWVIVMVPITIGGIGVQDAGYVVLMALIGIGAPVAVSMSLVEHVVARVASLPGAFFLSEATLKPSAGNSPQLAPLDGK
jgi:uncharacterized protein (TIRG00374 family)